MRSREEIQEVLAILRKVQEAPENTSTSELELIVMMVIQDTLAWVSELPPESGMDDAHQLLDCLSKTSASAVTE